MLGVKSEGLVMRKRPLGRLLLASTNANFKEEEA
jgi:hypothetical protein